MNFKMLWSIGPLLIVIHVTLFRLIYICLYLFITATKPTEFTVFPNVIKVNQSLTLSCSADVGAPNGSIKIWKLARNSNVTELIFTSNTSENNTENCTFVNVTFNYIVARDENVTLFRCSSQNVLNKGAGPSLDLQISEKCKTLVLMSSNINYSHNINMERIFMYGCGPP